MTSLSTILDSVINECGFHAPSSYFGNSEESAQRGISLANASAQELLDIRHTKMIRTATISMTASETYSLPSDYRETITGTTYENGDTWGADFPTTSQSWALLKASGINSGILLNLRIMDGLIHAHNPVDGESFRFEYLSNHPIQATGGGSTKAKYTVDTDEWLLDDRLHELDIIWRWKRLHGLDYIDDFNLFEKYKRNYTARDGGNRPLMMNQGDHNYYPSAQVDTWID